MREGERESGKKRARKREREEERGEVGAKRMLSCCVGQEELYDR